MDHSGWLGGLNVDDKLVSLLRRQGCYILILDRVYGVKVDLAYAHRGPIVRPGSDCHYCLLFHFALCGLARSRWSVKAPPRAVDVRRRCRSRLLEPGALQ